jgi:hypothetical protein
MRVGTAWANACTAVAHRNVGAARLSYCVTSASCGNDQQWHRNRDTAVDV